MQANLIDRVLLNGINASEDKPLSGPELMVAMTDLRHGLSIGALADGILMIGPLIVSQFRSAQCIALACPSSADTHLDLPTVYYSADSIVLEEFERLALRVAVSGAFPGAFPSYETVAHLRRPGTTKDLQDFFNMPMTLADGGIRDNLGLNLLELADYASRQRTSRPITKTWMGDTPGAEWQLDVIIASDGGQAFQSAAPRNTLESIARAIDLNGLETGAARLLQMGGPTPKIMLTTLGNFALVPDAKAQGFDPPSIADRPEYYLGVSNLSDEKLSALAALSPQQQQAQRVLQRYRSTDSGQLINIEGVRQRCGKQDPDNATHECSWLILITLIGRDIADTLEVFLDTPTLKDDFTEDEISALIRFGQYLVIMKSNFIRTALEDAARTQASKQDRPVVSKHIANREILRPNGVEQ